MRLRGLYSFLKFLVQRGELSADVLTRKLRIKLPESLPRAIEPQAVQQMLAVIDHVPGTVRSFWSCCAPACASGSCWIHGFPMWI